MKKIQFCNSCENRILKIFVNFLIKKNKKNFNSGNVIIH